MLHARRNDSLALYPGSSSSIGVWQLLGHSAESDVLRDAFAWVIAAYCNPQATPFIPALGLDHLSFRSLLGTYFAHFEPPVAWLDAQYPAAGKDGGFDEFQDLLQLLTEHAASDGENFRWVTHLIATACMGSDHLWQDLGLPDRNALSQLLAVHFPSLFSKNSGNMKWKKFFYRQLCERDGLVACSRPSCASCCDFNNCFGPEE